MDITEYKVDDTEKEEKKHKAVIRRVLSEILRRTGATAVPAKKATQNEDKFGSWGTDLDGTAPDKLEKLGWPTHSKMGHARDAVRARLLKHEALAEEVKRSRKHYNRVSDKCLPKVGPAFLFAHGEDPGWEGDKMPQEHHPLNSRSGKLPEEVTVLMKDLREVNNKFRNTGRLLNVLAHTNDMLFELLKDALQPDADTASIKQAGNDVFDVSRQALSRAMLVSCGAMYSHTIYERRLAFEMDSTLGPNVLPELQKARLCASTIDSNEFLFGANRDDMEKICKKYQDDTYVRVRPHITVDMKGQVKQPFHSKASNSAGRRGGDKKQLSTGWPRQTQSFRAEEERSAAQPRKPFGRSRSNRSQKASRGRGSTPGDGGQQSSNPRVNSRK